MDEAYRSLTGLPVTIANPLLYGHHHDPHAVHSVHSQQPSDYTRNSVYYAGQIMPTVPSTEQSSQDVLKELGVDLSNEGK
jgi:hypothetical protein